MTAQTMTASSAAPAVSGGRAVQVLPHSRVVTVLNGMPAWFVCDRTDARSVAVLGWPDARGLSRLTTYSKTRPGEYVWKSYRVGAADPGAGQIYYPLTPAGAGSAPNNVHSFNTGMLDRPEQALTPAITGVTSSEGSGECRWTLNTRLLGFDARRSVLITQAPGGTLTYQTFDFAAPGTPTHPDGAQRSSTPSLTVTGGTRLLTQTQEVFVFRNNGYTYTVRVAREGQPAGASVTVSRAGKTVQQETLTGYTYATRR